MHPLFAVILIVVVGVFSFFVGRYVSSNSKGQPIYLSEQDAELAANTLDVVAKQVYSESDALREAGFDYHKLTNVDSQMTRLAARLREHAKNNH